MAFIGLGPRQPAPEDVEAEEIVTEAVVVAVSRDHPLARRRSVTLGQLREEAMVTLPQESGQREMIEAAAASAGFTPRIAAESSDVRMLVDLAANGVGIALVPRSAAGSDRNLAVLEISRPRLQRRTFLIWRSQTLSPAARVWLDEARTQLVPAAGSSR